MGYEARIRYLSVRSVLAFHLKPAREHLRSFTFAFKIKGQDTRSNAAICGDKDGPRFAILGVRLSLAFDARDVT